MQRYLLTLLTGLLCLTLTARAQISLDGTLGKSGTLPGPNYQIGANLGQQHGGNHPARSLKNYDIIKRRCTAEKVADRKKRSKFVKTGRGGVSDAPTQLRSGSVRDVTEPLW